MKNLNHFIFILFLITLSLLFMKNSYAENNAVNITIKNVSSGEIIYQKIIPNNQYFHDYTIINGVKINITYGGNGGYLVSSTSNGITIEFPNIPSSSNIHISQTSGKLKVKVEVSTIEYNFNTTNTSNTNVNNNTKAPIPLNVYLLIIAFFTYILYRKLKI
ncbi:hypothetical protein ACO3VM_09075 [Methanocaldococcus sp. 10A]